MPGIIFIHWTFRVKRLLRENTWQDVETNACRCSHKCLLMLWGCHGSQSIKACNCKYAMMTMMMKMMLTVMLMIMIMSTLQHNDHDHVIFTA